ncbi:type II toxin-antitoxin system RelE/ParE family toxin [uncultured Parabacteroides sp.]|jgi:plasmid stabilization system protein ParE|uniref:type II toxin-antitoxin system RelE/ParE family toxin n=1 Tax=uncultured Parabacteroides sp. TaxID=512312 RepID=UPI0025E860DB|nr:type II toxin-antitoxin system RelE/ParE family toxin [uncultured Parabacteroides sp.]
MQVIWSPDAEKELDDLVEYCLITFGKRTASNVYRQIKHYDTLLTQNPLMGKHEILLEKYPQGFRSIVEHSHYKLIYFIDKQNNIINIVDIWDTRRAPESLVERLK